MNNHEENKRVAAFAMEKMFEGKTFFISDVDKALKILGRAGSGPAYDKLSALHCVKFGEIPPDILERVPIWINEVFGGPRLSVAMIPALFEGNAELPLIEDTRAPLRIGNK